MSPGRHRRPRDPWIPRARALALAIVLILVMALPLAAGGSGADAEPPAPPAMAMLSTALVVEPPPVPVIVVPTTTQPPPPPPPPLPEPEPEPEPAPSAPPSVPDLLAGQPSSGFGGVAPHVARAGHLIDELFDVDSIGGVASRPGNPTSDHPRGLALDFMVGRATGDEIAAFVLEHRSELRVKYVIWRQRINLGGAWSVMEDRGTDTANHYDHVHVSFN